MKSTLVLDVVIQIQSRPARGGWIEILLNQLKLVVTASRPAWGGWIEIEDTAKDIDNKLSRPAWGGWIEIPAPPPG